MDLIHNGLHSYKKAITLYNSLTETEAYDENYEYVLKDIILSLHHSIETLFKYIISNENEFLIYSDLKSVFNNEVTMYFNKPEKETKNKTIEFMDAVHRIIILKKLEITQSDYYCFESINDLRNSITHHEISFEKNQTEHFLSKLLPLLYTIYSKYIDIFEEYSNKNALNVSIKLIHEDFDNWGVKSLFNCIDLFNQSQEKVAYYTDNKKMIEKKFKSIRDNKINKNIEYIVCPLCNKEAFLRKMIYIKSIENTSFSGECEYCGLNLDKDTSSFLLFNFTKNNSSFSKFNKGFLKENMEQIFVSGSPLSETLSFDTLDYIHSIYSRNKEKIINIVGEILSEQMYDILWEKATSYFNDYLSDSFGYSDGYIRTVERNWTEASHNEIELILKIIDDFNTFSKGEAGNLKYFLSAEDEFEYEMEYFNEDQDIYIYGTCIIDAKLNLPVDKLLMN